MGLVIFRVLELAINNLPKHLATIQLKYRYLQIDLWMIKVSLSHGQCPALFQLGKSNNVYVTYMIVARCLGRLLMVSSNALRITISTDHNLPCMKILLQSNLATAMDQQQSLITYSCLLQVRSEAGTKRRLVVSKRLFEVEIWLLVNLIRATYMQLKQALQYNSVVVLAT